MAFVSERLNETHIAAAGLLADVLMKYRAKPDGSLRPTGPQACRDLRDYMKKQALLCWAPRLQTECLCAERVWFETLTFDPKGGSVHRVGGGDINVRWFHFAKKGDKEKTWNVEACRKEVSNYWKRVRSRYLKGVNRLRRIKGEAPINQKDMPRIRYRVAWEYGNNGLLHAHTLVFCKQSLKYAHLHAAWKAGISEQKLVRNNITAPEYLVKYIGKGADKVMGRVMASRSPAIGYVWGAHAIQKLVAGQLSYHRTMRAWLSWRQKQLSKAGSKKWMPDYSPVEPDKDIAERQAPANPAFEQDWRSDAPWVPPAGAAAIAAIDYPPF